MALGHHHGHLLDAIQVLHLGDPQDFWNKRSRLFKQFKKYKLRNSPGEVALERATLLSVAAIVLRDCFAEPGSRQPTVEDMSYFVEQLGTFVHWFVTPILGPVMARV